MSVVIDHTELRRIARRVFAARGSSEDEAGIIADHLVEANLKGHNSHGVGMIPSYLRNLGAGKASANEIGHVVSDTGSMIVYDGARGYGQIVAREATRMCAAEGLVSVSFVNITDRRPAVAPWRGGDARFGTNPVTIAIPGPTPDRPIIADMATSRIAMGKVRVARNKGDQVAADTLLDSDGTPTTDPHVMYRRPRGALFTFGEHKGYALAFICEMLAGAVTGSGTMRPERQDAESVTNGMLLIVIDPGRLVDRNWLADEITAMTDYVTASPPRNSAEPVLIPGDPERLMRAKRIAEGVPIDDETWREIAQAARGVNVLVEAPRN
jgi:uncharacterized oxidoreductase